MVGAIAINSAYRFDHYTHQWANTAVLWVCVVIALAAVRRALAVAILRPAAASAGFAAFTAVLLAVMGSAAVWQSDQSTVIPVYTEEAPATYGDSIYLFLQGRHNPGAVTRIEAYRVNEREFGRDASYDDQWIPTSRCWEILVTSNTIVSAETWPWEEVMRTPARLQVLTKVEVKETGGEWAEVSPAIYGTFYCLTPLGHSMSESDVTPLGSQGVATILVSTDSGPPVAVRLTDSKGHTAVINLQDPGTECAKYEHLTGYDAPDNEQPCHKIYDLRDQLVVNAGQKIDRG